MDTSPEKCGEKKHKQEGKLCAKKLTELWCLTLGLRAITQSVLFAGQFGLAMQYQSFHDAYDGIHPLTTSNIVLGPRVDGSSRSKLQGLNDSLAINSIIGAPDYFITMTATLERDRGGLPDFRETKAAHRPDLMHRVWNLKMKAWWTSCEIEYSAPARHW